MLDKSENKFKEISHGKLTLEKSNDFTNKSLNWIYLILKNEIGISLFRSRIIFNASKVDFHQKNFTHYAIITCVQETIKKVNNKDTIERFPKTVKVSFDNELVKNKFKESFELLKKEVDERK